MKRLTTMILAAALLAPASGLAMQKMRTNNNATRRVTTKQKQTDKAPLVTQLRVTVVRLPAAALHGSKLRVEGGALDSLAAGLERSAAGAEVSGKAPASVTATPLARRTNAKVDAAKKAEQEAARRAAQQQRAWAD